MVLYERRLLDLIKKSKKSLLILGPRQTGKSTLVRALKPDLTIDLSREVEYLSFASNPGELEERLSVQSQSAAFTVFIDEVQRLPSLLNTIQSVVDTRPGIRFFLTGSSARKLKRGQANLLPGRVHNYTLGPFCAFELEYDLNTKQALSTGTLPGVYLDPEKASREKTLRSYTGTYLKEEIQAESLTRNLEGFARFLSVAASMATEFLDYTKWASMAQISRQSAIRYFEILEDTLIVYRSNAFSKNKARRLVQHPRYYFFDNGVLNALLRNFEPSADRVGTLFENLFFSQVMAAAAAQDREIEVSTYRTEHGAEIDLIVDFGKELVAVELKASRNVGKNDLHGFKSFDSFYKKPHRKIVAYFGDQAKRIGDVEILPWQKALKDMGF